MIIYKLANQLSKHLNELKQQNITIAFVPTMGALHQGHRSLLEKAKGKKTIVVCSIFVNPTQFNDPKDFDKYPITIEKDIYLLENIGIDILFLPSKNQIYPLGLQLINQYNLGKLENILEGKFRPRHFQGVCQVVDRLLEIVNPHFLILGQKDYQQCLVLSSLLKLIDSPVKIIIGDTLRESDGLAMSSRNRRLSENDRATAPLIYKTILWIKEHLNNGDLNELKKKATLKLEQAGYTVDYVEIADAGTLNTIVAWNNNIKIVILIAAFINGVRLIDNVLIDFSFNNE